MRYLKLIDKFVYGSNGLEIVLFQVIFYVPVVFLSTQENIKLPKQLESGFKKTINSNKCLAKTTNQAQNRYLDYLTDPSFQGVNRLFVLPFKDADG